MQLKKEIDQKNRQTYLQENKRDQIDSVQLNQNYEIIQENIRSAIEILGTALIQTNSSLMHQFECKTINIQTFYQDLIRIAYRFAYILIAEQRNMVPNSDSYYFRHFSILKLLGKEKINGEGFDLWKRMQSNFELFFTGNPKLGIIAPPGDLFNNDLLSIIKNNEKIFKIRNDALLNFLCKLTSYKIKNGEKDQKIINFGAIREEDLGAIYESLLDCFPYYSKNTAHNNNKNNNNNSDTFVLISQDTIRKGSASYFTPKPFIDILIKTSIEPYIKEKVLPLKTAQLKEKALLNCRICDPSCGGGTFLLSSLSFLAEKLKTIRYNDEIPNEEENSIAYRDILCNCMYGVDMDSIAVDITKIALFLRARIKKDINPKLNKHIKTGNSLIGFVSKPKMLKITAKNYKFCKGNMETGIPSENKTNYEFAKKSLKTEANQLDEIFIQKPNNFNEVSPGNSSSIEPDLKGKNQNILKIIAESYISTFLWEFKKKDSFPTNLFLHNLQNGAQIEKKDELISEVEDYQRKYQIFNWFIEFPEVFSIHDGFDVILANPPWDIMLLRETEYFHNEKGIIHSKTQKERHSKILKQKDLKPELWAKYRDDWVKLKKIDRYIRDSGFFPNTSKGSMNTYALFAERCCSLINHSGRIGLLCPTGIAMNYNTQGFFKYLIQNNLLRSLFDFKNRNKYFGIDHRTHFCLLTLGNEKDSNISKIPMAFHTKEPSEIQTILQILESDTNQQEIFEDNNLILLDHDDFKLFNPNTLTCPTFPKLKNAQIMKKIYQMSKVILRRDKKGKIIENPWRITLKALFHVSNDSKHFISEEKLKSMNCNPLNPRFSARNWKSDDGKEEFLPLYDGRMFWLFDHRYNFPKFSGNGKQRKYISNMVAPENHQDPNYSVTPIYWVNKKNVDEKIPDSYQRKWFYGFRIITSASSERTFISSVFPYNASTNSVALMLTDINPKDYLLFIANTSSIIFDFIARQKITGNNMNLYIAEQLPVLPLESYNADLKGKISKFTFKLIYTASDLDDFAIDCGMEPNPYFWNEEKRFEMKCELDAIYAHIYNITREEFEYILDSFDQLIRYEMNLYGEKKTKRVCLEKYDKGINELIN